MLHLAKIDIKTTRDEFLALYNFLFKINDRVTTQLSNRMAEVSNEELVIYDLCQKLTTTTVYHSWLNKSATKMYNFSLPIGAAMTLIKHCWYLKYPENPYLYKIVTKIYHRLLEVISPGVFQRFGVKLTALDELEMKSGCSWHECAIKKTGEECSICKNNER